MCMYVYIYIYMHIYTHNLSLSLYIYIYIYVLYILFGCALEPVGGTYPRRGSPTIFKHAFIVNLLCVFFWSDMGA